MIVRRAVAEDAAPLAALALKTFNDTFAPFNREEDMLAYTSVTYGQPYQLREIENPNLITLVVEVPPAEHEGGTSSVASRPPTQVPGDARDDNGLAAYAQIRRSPGAPHGDVEIARFYVDQAYHGRGIAQTLMAAVESHARALGATRLWLGVWERNFRAQAFYRKFGFEKVGEHPFLLGTDLQTDWDMAREL